MHENNDHLFGRGLVGQKKRKQFKKKRLINFLWYMSNNFVANGALFYSISYDFSTKISRGAKFAPYTLVTPLQASEQKIGVCKIRRRHVMTMIVTHENSFFCLLLFLDPHGQFLVTASRDHYNLHRFRLSVLSHFKKSK